LGIRRRDRERHSRFGRELGSIGLRNEKPTRKLRIQIMKSVHATLKRKGVEAMKPVTRNLGLVFVISGLMLLPCRAQVSFQIYEHLTLSTAASRSPGALLTLDIVAKSIAPNLDSFTYRIAFPNQQFTLTANLYAAPFDNTLAPGGFNGSVPWSPLPAPITYNADAGSPGATPFVADIYRTTATTTGIGVTGLNVVLETFTLQIPSPSVVPVTYPISLNVLEAADSNGTLLPTTSGTDFLLTVVPLILTVTRAGGDIALSWNAISGRAYQVQFKTNLNQLGWGILTNVTATGATVTVPAATGPEAQRFYRVMVMP
jgi:hypothetical protein